MLAPTIYTKNILLLLAQLWMSFLTLWFTVNGVLNMSLVFRVNAAISWMDMINGRSWIYKWSSKGVYDIRYLEWVEDFIELTKRNNSKSEIICQCIWCDNHKVMTPEIVKDHLLRRRIVLKTTDWYFHFNFKAGRNNVSV